MRFKIRLFCLTLLCSILVPFALAAPLPTVKLEPRSGSLSDSFQLSVTVADAEITGKAIFDDNSDFSITFAGSSKGVQIVNGGISQQNSLLFRLEPSRTGNLMTPELKIPTSEGEVVVSPIEVKVAEGGTQAGHDVALEQTISSNKVFKDQQILQTIEILTAEELHSIRFDTPSYNGFLVEEIKPEEKDETIRNNTSYSVVRIRNVLFPLVANKSLIIPARRISAFARSPGLTGLVDPFSPSFMKKFIGSEEEVHLATKAHEVEVRDLPPVPGDAKLWNALSPLVGKTSLSMQYDKSPIAAGNPKDLRLIVETSGNINLISSASIPESKLYQSYEDSAQLRKYLQNGVLWYKKEFKISVVPNYGGTFRLNPISLTYFDPEREEYITTQTEPIEFEVSGPKAPDSETKSVKELSSSMKSESSIDSSPPGTIDSTDSDFRMLYIGVGLCLLALGYFIGNATRRRSLPHDVQEGSSEAPVAIESAKDAPELLDLFEDWLRFRLPSLEGSTSVRYGVRNVKLDSDFKFEIESLLDRIEEIVYGPANAGHDDNFETAKMAAINIINRLIDEE